MKCEHIVNQHGLGSGGQSFPFNWTNSRPHYLFYTIHHNMNIQMRVTMEFVKEGKERSYEFWISSYTLDEIEQKARDLYTRIHQRDYNGTQEFPTKFFTEFNPNL
jgi:hypothetical protein